MRFDSCDRENRTITLSHDEWFKPKAFWFAKDLPFPRLDGIAPGDYVSVQFEMKLDQTRIVAIEKYRPDMDSTSA